MLQSSQGFFFFNKMFIKSQLIGLWKQDVLSSAFREFQQLEIPVRSSRTRVWFLHGEKLENTRRFLGVFSNFSSAQENLRFSLWDCYQRCSCMEEPRRCWRCSFSHGQGAFSGKKKKSRKKNRLKNHHDVYEGPAFHKLRGKKISCILNWKITPHLLLAEVMRVERDLGVAAQIPR